MGRKKASRDFDYLVVGAGFAGGVIAERLASGGRRVLVVDRRDHIGGNAFDHYDPAGILVHKYGPHIFHTNSEKVFAYLSRFTSWRPYEHRVLASVDGKLLPIPINLDTINRVYGLDLDSEECEAFLRRYAEPCKVRSFEDAVVSTVGRDLYKKFFRGYTRKQWGRDPSELDASMAARVPTRTNRDDRYFTDKFQFMPSDGYRPLFDNLLDHPNITVLLRTDYMAVAGLRPARETVFTGPIDEFFDYRFGPLPYRSLRFRFVTLDRPIAQPAPVVNYPNTYRFTRVTEMKWLTGQDHPQTTLVYEYPCADGDPYYPIPCLEAAQLYKRYRALAHETPGVHFAGRLGTYKYYNMDQVVGQALALSERITASRTAAARARRAA